MGNARRPLIVSRADVLGGAPCFRGTRIPVFDIAAMVSNGDGVGAIVRAYPSLSDTDVQAAVDYAQRHAHRPA